MSRQVFISHASQDAAQAQALCAGLERQGLACWIAPRDIAAGQSWGASIVQALDQCPVLVLLLTPHANQSRHVVREVERADGKLARIITVRTTDQPLNHSLEYFLSTDHWFDAVGQSLDSLLPALTQAVRSLLALPRDTPRAAVLAGAGQLPPPPPDTRTLQRSFDEQAPDDWDRAPAPGAVGRLFRQLFADR